MFTPGLAHTTSPRLGSRFAWLLIFTALLIGVINPVSCIVHCLGWPAEASKPAASSFYLCHGIGAMTEAPTLASVPTTAIVHSPKVAPLFDSVLHTAAVVLAGLVVLRTLHQAGWQRHRQIVFPPILPPPQAI